jgi:hypothetical protein
MAKTASQRLNDYMPAVLDKDDLVYKALVADQDTDTGALTNEIKLVSAFIDYYTASLRVDDAETGLLDFIVEIFAGLRRSYSEPDDYLRRRYKALIERKKSTHWNGKNSIRNVFTYFFDERNIYLIERYPVINLIINGEFDSLESWTVNNSDTEFRLVYSWSFEGGSAALINPAKANSAGYIEQRVAGVSSGIYELLFFYSSPKGKKGDVWFTIRNAQGNYWNGSAWVSMEYSFLETHNDTPGYYKAVQKTINVPSATDITFRFKNKNGGGALIDSVRFGKTTDPAMRIFIISEPDLFFNGEIFFDKKYLFNGFKSYYIQTDMESVLEMIHPAGVYAEMSVISSRLNTPWDRITIEWKSTHAVKWHTTFDATKNFNNGSIILQDIFYDNSFLFDGEYNFDSKKVTWSVKPTDLMFNDVCSNHYKKYKYNKKIKLKNQLYFNGRVGFDCRYNFSGAVEGVRVGLSVMTATRHVMNQVTAVARFDGTWKFDGSLKFDGMYTAYQPGTETYPVEGVMGVETKNLKYVLATLVINPTDALKIGKVGFGVGDAVETPDDTGLTSPYIKTITASRINSDNSLTFDYDLLSSEANGKVLKELGLYCNDGVTMVYRERRDTVVKDIDTEISGSITIIL